MKIFLAFCHPRRDSLTGTVADAFLKGASKAGHEIEFFDLYREKFDPVLRECDEPNDGTLENYSKEVQESFTRLNKNDAIVMVFPLWWWSMPAMLKGWIDRVWNYGLTYGPSQHNIQKGAMLILAEHTEAQLKKRNYDESIKTSLDVGIFNYNDIHDTDLIILGGTGLGREHCSKHIKTAYEKGLKF